ncbi:TAXI family TRAP transporter solute-binding subunit [Nesterenkonia ebinurensis]|uniref:TAXI family TRAP transporter solute-binding subunit n=1 Tax=Nesterenkonia ebinurensis TaxID=2608252 RepID=UPI00123DE1D3|nr:TAXI family TRAP transporter solute-binding subunit [Nesterenkonia ebinurensis]
MRKHLAPLAILSISALTLSACNGEDNGPDASDLRFPTASTTGVIYPLGASMSNVWNSDLEGVTVHSEASNGGVENLNLMASGDADITFATAGIAYEALHGEGTFEGRQHEGLRVLAGLYENPNQVVVRADQGIESISDLEGRNFAPGATGSTPEVEARAILPVYGVEYPDGINANFVGFDEAIDLMRNRQVDGALIQAGLPTAAVTEMTSTVGAELIPIEGEERDQLLAEYPWYNEFTIPADTYDNQPEDVETISIKMLLLVDESMDDDLAYDLAQAFWENLDQLDQQSVVEQIDISGAAQDLGEVPLHDGAAQFYEENGNL